MADPVTTLAYKRKSVRDAVFKIKAFSLKALREAEMDGRERDIYIAKIRTCTAILNEIEESCEAFMAIRTSEQDVICAPTSQASR
jgi:hypothetical protein